MRIGFVGLGNMGAPMARRIAADGWPLTVYARRAAAVEPLADLAPSRARSLRELAEAADLVSVCVVDDAQVEEVVTGLLPGLRRGAIIAVHSTVHPETCRRLAARASGGGVDLVDAPVSGGPTVVPDRGLAVMAGGDDRAVEACRPLFASFARSVHHMGPVGAGQLAKLVNNVVFIANLGVVADAIDLGGELGLDRGRLAEVMGAGSGASFALGLYARALSRERFRPVTGLLRKDLDLLLDVAREAGLDVVGLAAAAERTVRGLG